MLIRIKTLFKDNILYISICVTLLIAILSLIKLSEGTTINVTHIDKLEHAFAYSILTLSWLFTFNNSFHKKEVRYLVVCSCVFYGIIIEVLQTTLTTYRTASFLDVLANTIGVLVAFIIFKRFFKNNTAI